MKNSNIQNSNIRRKREVEKLKGEFEKETSLMKRLCHPYIVQLFG